VSQSKKKHIFISYQRKDVSTVKKLAQVLEKSEKYSLWYDQKLQGGQIWWDEIIRNIQAADIVILVLSRNYMKSKPCELERVYAKDLGKAIIPLQIDAGLQYSSLPTDISKLQIRKYSGQAEDYQVLLDDIDALSSPPLPQNYRTPPPAPISDPAGSKRNRWFGAIGAIALVVLAITAVIAPNLNQNSETPRQPDSTPSLSATEAQGQLGNFDVRLQYGGQDSFTIIVNEESNLWGIRLNSSGLENQLVLTERFPDLQSLDYQLSAGACLRFEREGTTPVVPMACDSEQILRLTLSPAEIFWFDASSNLYLNVSLKHGDSAPRLCPHDNGSGDCQISFEG
jgi:hypothetical protein